MDFRHEVVIPNEDLPFRMFIFEGKDGNYKVTKHWHHSVEIFLVKEGSMDFYIHSRKYLLQKDEFVIVNSNDIHSIECPNPNITIVLQIPVDSFEGYMKEEPFIMFSWRDDSGRSGELVELVTDMYKIYDKKEYGYELLVNGKFLMLLYLLLTQFRVENPDKESVRQKKYLDRLSGVTQYMKQNYNQELTLEAVSRRFGFTPTYLSRLFQKYAQVNYRTYLIDLRVKYAFRELVNTDHGIGDIALEHGFPDSRSFSKAFKKRYGCLPSEYRRSMAAGEGSGGGVCH